MKDLRLKTDSSENGKDPRQFHALPPILQVSLLTQTSSDHGIDAAGVDLGLLKRETRDQSNFRQQHHQVLDNFVIPDHLSPLLLSLQWDRAGLM